MAHVNSTRAVSRAAISARDRRCGVLTPHRAVSGDGCQLVARIDPHLEKAGQAPTTAAGASASHYKSLAGCRT